MIQRIWTIGLLVALASACSARSVSSLPGASQATATYQRVEAASSTPKPLPILLQVYVANTDGNGGQGKGHPLCFQCYAVFKVTKSNVKCVLGTKAIVTVQSSSFLTCQWNNGNVFYNPKALALDSQGNLYVADAGKPAGTVSAPNTPDPGPAGAKPGGVVWKLTPNGKTWTVSCVGVPSCSATPALGTPYGVAVDHADPANVYILGTPTGGTYRAVLESSDAGTLAPVVLPTPTAKFTNPTGIAIDGFNNIYVSDYATGLIWERQASGGSWSVIETLAAGANPSGVAVNQNGSKLYVTDTAANAVLLFTGTMGTSWSKVSACVPAIPKGSNVQCINPGNVPGWGGFKKPHGVAVGLHTHMVFVADTNNAAIKAVTSNGRIFCVQPSVFPKCDGSHIEPGGAGFFHPSAVIPYPPRSKP